MKVKTRKTFPVKHGSTFIPALRYNWLTRFYDPLFRWALKEDRLRRILVEQVGVRSGQRIVDLGCGTATLTALLKRSCPTAKVVGIDIDPIVLRIARERSAGTFGTIALCAGSTLAPPLKLGAFDKVVSSLLFHHLTLSAKSDTLGQAYDLLKPGGTLHIADWGPTRNWLLRAAFLSVQFLDGFNTTNDNVRGRLPALMQEAGFVHVEEITRVPTLFGSLSFYQAVAPARQAAADTSTRTLRKTER